MYFYDDETVFIGRTAVFYDGDDDEDLFIPDYWTFSTDENDDDFAGEVYVLDEDGKSELGWWIRCRQMNEYQRMNCRYDYNNRSREDEWNYLVKNFATRVW